MTINEKLQNLPDSSGVYLMYDSAGKVIYVGKALVLKNRVRQYFHSSVKPPKVEAMMQCVVDFGYIITLSEKDAFSLESSLVKKYNPKYNILLKDDKASPYIRIDLRTEFPILEITRRPKRDGAKYFGPFFMGVRAGEIASIVRSAYRIRFNCKTKIKVKYKSEGNAGATRDPADGGACGGVLNTNGAGGDFGGPGARGAGKRECLNYHIK